MQIIELKQVDKLQLKYFTIAVYQAGENPHRCVRDQDMPEDLAAAFSEASAGSACPAPNAGYLHDFVLFMDSNNPVAKKYSGRMELNKVGTLEYKSLSVPVWRVADPEMYKAYPKSFVRDEDMPADLAKAFLEWQTLAAAPGFGMSYLHDFTDFMDRGGQGWKGDYSEIVNRYR